MSLVVRQITPNDVALMEALLSTFGDAFGDADTYATNRPSASYLRRLLGSDYFIALAASKNDEIVAGIAAYELRKFEQERSEIYIYDLAVAAAHRREGIATALISELKKIAAARGAYVMAPLVIAWPKAVKTIAMPPIPDIPPNSRLISTNGRLNVPIDIQSLR